MTDFSKTEINIDKKDYSNYRILIVSTSWNREIIDVMQQDAISELKGFNVNHIDSVEVPGAFELSQAAEKFISSYDAILALGTIIKGETYHFEVLAHETARSLSQVSISNKKPVIFGVLTTDNELQAKQRAEVKGSEYAKSLLMMIDLFSKMPLVKKKLSPTKTREILLQALYQKEISDISNTNLINQFKKTYREFDISNVAEKLKGINKNNDSLNKNIADNSSIEMKSIGEIEISILRQSIFELENSDIDYPIVINEAVKLAKKFGQEDSYRFINGVLDSYIASR